MNKKPERKYTYFEYFKKFYPKEYKKEQEEKVSIAERLAKEAINKNKPQLDRDEI